jgi:hypothetical protein
MKKTLEELKQKHAALTKKILQETAKLERLKARKEPAHRRTDTRRKVILGGYELAARKAEPERLKAYLVTVSQSAGLRDAERAVILQWINELGESS